jgi:tripartite-type tricarboxylate transporter receptor subunit TctC
MGQSGQGIRHQAELIGAIMPVARVLAIALWAFALAPGAADAQAYPSRTIKLIVPFTPGSPVDAAARVITQHLQARLGQSIIIENRAGGGTTIGTKAVVTAAPDGYTLLLIGPNITYVPVLHPNLDFDPIKSLAPVATAVTWSHVLVVAPSVPAKSMAELIAHAKASPGQLVFGFGLGTTPHILGETLKQAAGIDLANIPYRGGEQARTDRLGGRVHINIAPVASLLPLIQDGKVRPLAFTGPTRGADLPDVPTMIECGLPQVGFNPDVWLGVLAPAGTPAAVIEKLNAEINESLKSPALQAAFGKLGFETKLTTPQGFAAFLAVEAQKWPLLLRAAGLKAE